jgi:hypothetical protein
MSSTPPTREYNWHPAVHTRYGEKLYFFLIRLDKPARGPVADQIRRLLALADLRWACEYAVFGYWDALIRVWLNPTSQHRLVHYVLASSDSNIADVRYFEATEIRHLWRGTDENLLVHDHALAAVVDDHDDAIRLANDALADPDPHLVDTLTSTQPPLLFARPATSEGAVKFYVSLQRTEGDISPDSEAKAVLEAVEESGLGPRSSVYTGIGTLAQYLVRCVADTYADVLHWTASLDNSLKGSGLRPMTLLIANTNARESDSINAFEGLSHEDEHVLELLNLPAGSPELLKLTPDQRTAFRGLISATTDIAGGDLALREQLRGLLKACLLDDRTTVGASIATLLEFEWLLGEYLKLRVWPEVYSNNWRVELGQLFDDTEDASESGIKSKRYKEMLERPDSWTLGPIVHLAIDSAELDARIAARITHQLGQGWQGRLRKLLDVRNYLAHGGLRKVDSLYDFQSEWGRRLLELMEVLALQSICDALITGEG